MVSIRTRSAACLCWAVAAPAAVFAQAPQPVTQSLSLGAYFAEGDYGATDTTKIRYFPLSYEVRKGKWGFQALVPRLEVTGLGNVLVNVGGITRAVAGTQRTTERGIGDVITSVTYQFDPWSANAPFIDLRLDVKLPTADEQKSLGTGEIDYTLQLDLSKNLGSNLLFVSLGKNFRGTSSLYPGLQDSAFLQAGVARTLTTAWGGGVYYDFREAASVFSGESHELVPYVTWQLSEHWSVTGLTVWGFTDASADWSALGQISYRW